MPDSPVDPLERGPSSVKSTSERPAASRLRRAAGAKPAAKKPSRPPNPTRTIQVGSGHVQIAEAILTRLQAAAAAKGTKLDVGEFPDNGLGSADSDPDRPVRLAAHAVARVADRLPFSRKISRHMEGTDNRAGILSDVLALITELLRRNPSLVEDRLESFGDDLQKARSMRAAKQQQTNPMEGMNNHAA